MKLNWVIELLRCVLLQRAWILKRYKLYFCWQEYADNLKDSGVHGAVLVLDPIFGADELAQALGIHVSKNIIRRHLTSELLSVLVPAR